MKNKNSLKNHVHWNNKILMTTNIIAVTVFRIFFFGGTPAPSPR